MKQTFYIAETEKWGDINVLGKFKKTEESFFWIILESKTKSLNGITEEKHQELLKQIKESLYNTGKPVTIKDMAFKIKNTK